MSTPTTTPTTPGVELRARPVDPATARHPLAHRSGLALLDQCIAAQERWRRLTPVQRAALAGLHPVVLAAVRQAWDTDQPVIPPALPPGVHPRTEHALNARLLTHGGRLTVEGVLTVWWAAEPKEGA